MRITYLHQYFNTPDKPESSISYEIAGRLALVRDEVNIVTTNRDGLNLKRM
jgi:hypothetical protein